MKLKLFFFGLLTCCCSAAEQATLFDFTNAGHGWVGNPQARVETTQNGLTVKITGEDPWIEGSFVDIPGAGKAPKLRVTLEASCSNSGACRLFFAAPDQGFNEENANNLKFSSKPSPKYMGIIPLIANKLRFRIDPPGSDGSFSIKSIKVEPLTPLVSGKFSPPADVNLGGSVYSINNDKLRIIHNGRNWNSFVCYYEKSLKMLQANPDESMVYWDGKKSVEVSPKEGSFSFSHTANELQARCTVRDEGGAEWVLKRTFTSANNEISIETSISTSQQRNMAHLPWITLFAGKDNFGTSKQQALLPGVEYLANEPSSNEKEVKGKAANRKLIEQFKLCYPMMAIAAEDHWVSVAWDKLGAEFSPVFDSPDRIFNSGGHVMGLWSPAVGDDRFQGELEVYGGFTLEANKTYTRKVVIRGGKGGSITEAIGDYVQRNTLPPLPKFKGGLERAIDLLAYGWLDSAAHEGNKWRHAVFGKRFPPSFAPDVPSYLLWLAANTENKNLKSRLEETANKAIAEIPEGHQGVGGVSHIKLPAGALLYGNLASLVNQASKRIISRTATLDKNGGYAIYKQAEGKPDYASTLGSDHCNGFTAMTVERMMQDATLTGDRSARDKALKALDRMTELYSGQVPCGAQPWEMPLHTPDIVASGILIRSYVLGYLLTENPNYLEQARYWAWTGAAMVYLAPPVDGEIGTYATIGVIGATNWTSPNWIGQPVQWCGLVYRSALEELARVDKKQSDTWQKIARGITITGLQMTWPKDDPENRGGLLPDYLLLKEQKRDGPAINPGTIQANLAEVYGRTPMYTVTRLSNGMLVHVPGEIKKDNCKDGSISINIDAWPEREYKVLITGVAEVPGKISWNDKDVKMDHLKNAKAVIVHLKGDGVLSIAKCTQEND